MDPPSNAQELPADSEPMDLDKPTPNGLATWPQELLDRLCSHLSRRYQGRLARLNWKLYFMVRPTLFDREIRENGNWIIAWAICWKSFETLKYAFKRGASLTDAYLWPSTMIVAGKHVLRYWLPMDMAAFAGCIPIMQFLENRGCEIDMVGISKRTPIYFVRHTSMLRHMLDQGCKVNVHYGSVGWTPLISALHEGFPPQGKLLVGPDTYPKNRSTIRPDLIRCYIEEGHADPNLATNEGTPLWYAITNKKGVSFVEVLLEHGADPNKCVTTTPLYQAMIVGDMSSARFLIKYNADCEDAQRRSSSLIAAIAYGRLEGVKMLLEAGANTSNKWAESTPLQFALQTCSFCSCLNSKNGHKTRHIEIAKHLVNSRADINSDADGETPLLTAVVNGVVEVINLLLAGGADPNLESPRANGGDPVTPLVAAVGVSLNPDESLIVAKLLIEAKADVNLATSGSLLPLEQAINRMKNDAAILLLRQGADPTHRSLHWSPLTTVIARYNFEKHPVHKHFELMDSLIENNDRPHWIPRQGDQWWTYPPLNLALTTNDEGLLHYLLVKKELCNSKRDPGGRAFLAALKFGLKDHKVLPEMMECFLDCEPDGDTMSPSERSSGYKDAICELSDHCMKYANSVPSSTSTSSSPPNICEDRKRCWIKMEIMIQHCGQDEALEGIPDEVMADWFDVAMGTWQWGAEDWGDQREKVLAFVENFMGEEKPRGVERLLDLLEVNRGYFTIWHTKTPSLRVKVAMGLVDEAKAALTSIATVPGEAKRRNTF